MDEIQDLMTSFGRIDALAPFDENEEPDSEEEDEGGEEIEGGDDQETNDLSLCIEGMGLSKDSPLLNDSGSTGNQVRFIWYFFNLSFSLCFLNWP